MTDEGIRAIGEQAAAVTERIYKEIRKTETHPKGTWYGAGMMENDDGFNMAKPGEPPLVYFRAHTHEANAFYGFDPTNPFPFTPEELGALTAGVLIGWEDRLHAEKGDATENGRKDA